MRESLLLSAIIISGLLTSCGNNPKQEEPSPESTMENNTTSADSTSSEQEGTYSSSSYSSTNGSRGHNSMDADDKEYWESVNREKALRDRGMDRAADIERKARLEYVQGGGYHSKDGGSQVHFQGSKEQEEQLRQMDEMGW